MTQRLPPSEPLLSARVIQRRVRRRNFAMWPAFPSSDYYGLSAPPRDVGRRRTCPPRDRLPYGEGDHQDGSHVHFHCSTGRRPAIPCSIATATPQTFTAASRRRQHPGQEFPAPREQQCVYGVRATAQPLSARFELVSLLRRRSPTGSSVHLSVSLAGPAPSGSADTSRRCRGCLPPSPTSPGPGCPQASPGRCDGPEAMVSHHRTVQERLVALDVAAPAGVRGLLR